MQLYPDDASVDDGLWDCLGDAQTAAKDRILERDWAFVVADYLDEAVVPGPSPATIEDSWVYRCEDLPAARALARHLLAPSRPYVAVVAWQEGDEVVFDGQVGESDAAAARWRTPIRRRLLRGPELDVQATGMWELVEPLRTPTWTGSTWTLREAGTGEVIADLFVEATSPPFLHATVTPRPGRETALAERTVAPPLIPCTLHRPDGAVASSHDIKLVRELGSWTVDFSSPE